MRRNLLGIIAAALVIAGLVGLWRGFSEEDVAGMGAGVGIRAGLILGAIWLAYPQLAQLFSRVPGWLMGALLLGGVVVAIRPRYILVVAPLLAVILSLHYVKRIFASPRKSRRRKSPQAPKPPAKSEI